LAVFKYIGSARIGRAGGVAMLDKLAVVIEHDLDGYFAYCPDLPGCHTQGDTFEEAMLNIREAASLYVSTLSEEERLSCLSKEVFTTAIQV
jgi:predicted RNase H-like HicB family nuclease